MPSSIRRLLDRLAREEREVWRQLSVLRRHTSGQPAIMTLPSDGSADLFKAALGVSAGQHDEVLLRCLMDKLRALAEAQERLREGTYGLCRECGCSIPRRRLEAMPTATLCVPCQEQREAAQSAA